MNVREKDGRETRERGKRDKSRRDIRLPLLEHIPTFEHVRRILIQVRDYVDHAKHRG